MTTRRKKLRKPLDPPRNAADGSAWVRCYLIDLYDRRDGEAADWQLIAETAFKVGLDAIDAARPTRRRMDALNRLHAAAYDRLAEAGSEQDFAYRLDTLGTAESRTCG